MSVYFVRDTSTGHIKIGTAVDVARRLQGLQTASAHELVLLATIDGSVTEERTLHARFAESRVRGEWFHPSPGLVAFLELSKLPIGTSVNPDHRFMYSSGSTKTCALCGCVRYSVPRRRDQYSQWKPRKHEWSDYSGSRDPMPPCVAGRLVPEWLRSKYETENKR